MIEWLESHMLTCYYKKHFGMECMGCGIQRSFIALLKGNIYESFLLYPALIPLILMFGFLFCHLIFQFKYGAFILKYMFIFNAIIILVNYILKFI